MINLEKSVSVSDQVRAAFPFKVQKAPLLGMLNGSLLATDDFGLFRSDTKDQVHSRPVKAVYTPHTVEQVITLCEVAESIFDHCELRCHFNRGHYVRLTPSKDYRMSVYGTEDNVFPVLMIRAPYDLKSVESCLGFYRDACMNMARLQSVVSTSMRIPHLLNLDQRMDELVAMFTTLKESWEDLTAFIGKMQARQVHLVTYLREVFGPDPVEPGRQRDNYVDREDAIIKRVSAEGMRTDRGLYSGVVSIWQAFNGVQGYFQHDAPRMGKVGSFERILKTNDHPSVKMAEKVAVRYCE